MKIIDVVISIPDDENPEELINWIQKQTFTFKFYFVDIGTQGHPVVSIEGNTEFPN